jgi:hypothetical protein
MGTRSTMVRARTRTEVVGMSSSDEEELTPFEEAREPANKVSSAPEGSELTDAEVEAVRASQSDPGNATRNDADAS